MNRLAVLGVWMALVVTLAAPLTVSAQPPAAPKKEAPGVVELPNPLVAKQTRANLTIQQIIGRAINVALGVVGSVALVMFFYGGYLWLISGGSADKIKKGKETLVWATIGLAVIFGSGVLVKTVISVLETK